MKSEKLLKKDKQSFVFKFQCIVQGFIMGIAELVPGVSGSTLALIMGIYDDFINLLHSISTVVKTLIEFVLRRKNKEDLKKAFLCIDFKFGFLLILGMAISIAILSRILESSIEENPQYISAIFFGMVLASIPIPFAKITKKNSLNFAIIFLTAALTFTFLGINPADTSENPSTLLLFFGGMVGVSGLILPGVSGSFILLMIGLYEYIISLISSFAEGDFSGGKILDILIFGAGLIFGFIFFVRILKYLLNHFNNKVFAFLTGLMIGSLRVLYPLFEGSFEEKDKYNFLESSNQYSTVIVILLVIFSFLGILLLSQFSKAREEVGNITVE